MSNQATGVVDQRIAKALSHPVRAHILQILNDRVASPNEIAEEIKEPLGNVSYHVRALLNLELRRAGAHGPAPWRDRALLQGRHAPVLLRPRLDQAAALRASGHLRPHARARSGPTSPARWRTAASRPAPTGTLAHRAAAGRAGLGGAERDPQGRRSRTRCGSRPRAPTAVPTAARRASTRSSR